MGLYSDINIMSIDVYYSVISGETGSIVYVFV